MTFGPEVPALATTYGLVTEDFESLTVGTTPAQYLDSGWPANLVVANAPIGQAGSNYLRLLSLSRADLTTRVEIQRSTAFRIDAPRVATNSMVASFRLYVESPVRNLTISLLRSDATAWRSWLHTTQRLPVPGTGRSDSLTTTYIGGLLQTARWYDVIISINLLLLDEKFEIPGAVVYKGSVTSDGAAPTNLQSLQITAQSGQNVAIDNVRLYVDP